MIEFKTEQERIDWTSGNLPPFLVEVVKFYAALRRMVLGVNTVITDIGEDASFRRTYATHREFRAVDCRVDMTQEPVEEAIRLLVCARFPTHIARMPRIAPLRHGTAPHAHIQITRGEKENG